MIRQKRRLKAGALFASMLVIIISFQNCEISKLSFDPEPVKVDLYSHSNRYFTNDKTIEMVVNLDDSYYEQLRYSFLPDFSDNPTWIPYDSENKKILIELKDQYAADGSRDGKKTIYVQASYPKKNIIKNAELEFFLDTQVPKIEAEGILRTGPQGVEYKLNQSVPLEVQFKDVGLSNEVISGIDPDLGYRLAISEAGDCTQELSNDTGWGPQMLVSNFAWPKSSGLEAFYVCLFVRDRAENIAVYTSNSMTGLWKVLAGQTAIGNGGSVNAPAVRFKSPGLMFAIDTESGPALVVSDPEMNVMRKIELSGSRIISDYENKVGSNSRRVKTSEGFTVTKSTAGTSLFVIKSETDVPQKITAFAVTAFAKRVFKGQESLLIATDCGIDTSTVTNCYLADVPLSKIKELVDSKGMMAAADLANYYIVGNGMAPYESAPVSPVLTANDSKTDIQFAIGHISAIAVNEDGSEIYLGTTGTGSGLRYTAPNGTKYAQGIQSLRILRANDSGFSQFLQPTRWIQDLSYVRYKKGDSFEEQLAIVGSSGFYLLNKPSLVTDNLTFKNSLSNPLVEYLTGVLIVPQANIASHEIYVSSKAKSKIYRFDSAGKLIESFGRDFDTSNDPVKAADFTLGYPDGIIVDPRNNDVYITDIQVGAIHRITAERMLEKVYSDPTTVGTFVNGFKQRITGNFTGSNKVLYFPKSTSSPVILQLDLQAPEVPPATLNFTSASDAPKMDIASIAYDPIKNALLVGRNCSYQTCAGSASFNSYVEGVSLGGAATVSSRLAGNPTKAYVTANGANKIGIDIDVLNGVYYAARNRKTMVDSVTGKVFMSAASVGKLGVRGLLVFDADSKMGQYLEVPVAASFEIVNEGDDLRSIIFNDGAFLKRSLINLAKLELVGTENLCFPGAKISNVGDFAIDKNGDLNFTDSSLGKVIQYHIRLGDKNVYYNEVDGKCQQSVLK
jgi:hypothetical protein